MNNRTLGRRFVCSRKLIRGVLLAWTVCCSSALAEDMVWEDEWKNRLVTSESSFGFAADGTFVMREVRVIKVLGETKIFRQYGRGTWKLDADGQRIVTAGRAVTYCTTTDSGSFTIKGQSLDLQFRREGELMFVVDHGQRSMNRSSQSVRELQRIVDGALK